VHRLVTAYSRELVRQAERHPNLVVLDADLVLDCGLIPFRKRFPERFVECGIAEQDMVSQAGGMALRGLLPIVHSFACFLSTRPNEQIYNNATERTKVIYVASLAGLLPAGPGHSHQSVRDISALGGVPDLVMVEPCSEVETEQALDFCVNEASSSSYIRLVSIPAETPYALPPDYRLAAGRGVVLREGRDAALVGYGPVLLTQAWRAAELLARESGLEVAVINLPWLNRVDRQWLSGIAERYPWIFTLDNHYLHGGQGQLLLAELVELPERPLPRARRLGVTRIPLGGGNTEVLRAHHLDAEGLARQVREALAKAK
jgi:transketolase